MIHLPALNASLNAISASLLLLGYWSVRRKNIYLHKRCMLLACLSSTLFLISYLYYHYHYGSTPFQKEGLIRLVYFTILISHTILATVIVPLVVITLIRALKGQIEKHRKIARITLPLWMYVSVTGVVIYGMLYQM